jgi:hypothetical protein
LKLNRPHQLLVYAEDATVKEDNIYTIKKNTDKYRLVSHHQNAGQNHNINGQYILSKCGKVQIRIYE